MSLLGTLGQAANNARGSVQAGAEAFKNFSFKNIFSGPDLPISPPGRIERGLSFMGRNFVGKPLGAGLKVADWSLGVLAKPIAWVAAAPGAVFRTFPTAAPIATVGIIATGIGTWFARRRSNALQQDFADAQMQAMAAQAGQPSYMNSASQAEVDARIAADRAAGVAATTHVDAAAARASQQPATAAL
jgi:hypothetical protein